MTRKHISYDVARPSFCNLRAASQDRGFPHNTDMPGFFATNAGRILLGLLAFALALGTKTSAGIEQITSAQARSVALLVARHDAINVDDADTVVDSMDGNGPFVAGYFSFIFIAVDPHQAGKDRTLAMYAVSPRTGDTWELNLCKHYEFPELLRVQRSIRRKTGAHPGDEAAAPRAVGCAKTLEPVSDQGHSLLVYPKWTNPIPSS